MPKLITTADFIKAAITQHGDTYTYENTTYTNESTKVIVTCKQHGDFFTRPGHFKRGVGCKECQTANKSINYRKPQIEFITQSIQLHNNKYDYSQVQYINNKTPVIIICPTHGPFSQRPHNHLCSKRGCPVCSASKGELAVRDWLVSHNISYIREYKFTDCIHKSVLKFDFYLPLYNTVIEYQGIQHYKPLPFGRSADEFTQSQLRDELKREYTAAHGISLIEIPYTRDVATMLNNTFLPFLETAGSF